MGSAKSSIARKLLPGALLAILVLFGLAVYSDGPALLKALATFDLSVLPLAIALASLNFVARFVRWQYYLGYLGIHVPARSSAGIFFSGLSMSITPGKIGELIKCFMLRTKFEVRIASSAPIVVAERYTDIVGIMVLVAIGATQFPGGGPILLIGGVVVLIGLVVMTMSDTLIDRAGAFLSKTLFKGRAFETDWARESGTAFRRLLRGAPLTVGTTLGALAWFFECLAFLVVLRGFGQVDIGLLSATFTYTSATLAGALSMLPGGLGATEGSMAALLAGLGMPRADAAGVTLVARAVTLWWGVALGIVVYAAHASLGRATFAEAEAADSE